MSGKRPLREQVNEYNFAHARDSFRQQEPPRRQTAYTATESRPTRPPVQRDTVDDEEVYPTRPPNSTRRYPPPGPAYVEVHDQRSRTRAQPRRTQRTIPTPQARGRPHALLFVGVGMLLMLALWLAFGMVANWWLVTQDDLHYGRPRTYQTDADVGHGGVSHFIAINWHRHIEVIEIPQNNVAASKFYDGPMLTGDGQDLTPVTLEFKDVNGDGKSDMIIEAGDSRFVYINDHGAFRPQRAGEQVNL